MKKMYIFIILSVFIGCKFENINSYLSIANEDKNITEVLKKSSLTIVSNISSSGLSFINDFLIQQYKANVANSSEKIVLKTYNQPIDINCKKLGFVYAEVQVSTIQGVSVKELKFLKNTRECLELNFKDTRFSGNDFIIYYQ